MENYLVSVDKKFVVKKAATFNNARIKALNENLNAREVYTIGKVEDVLEFLKPYIVISKHASL